MDNFISVNDAVNALAGKSGFMSHQRYLAIRTVRDVKPATVKPEIHAKWIEVKTGPGMYDYQFRCTHCKCCTPDKAYVIAPDFCPSCGATMT